MFGGWGEGEILSCLGYTEFRVIEGQVVQMHCCYLMDCTRNFRLLFTYFFSRDIYCGPAVY